MRSSGPRAHTHLFQTAENTARCRIDKLQKLQIEAKTANIQLEEELAKAWPCLFLMDEGRGGGCNLDIEAAMVQVVAAGRLLQ